MDGKKSVLKVTPSTDLKSLTGSWLEVNNNAKVRKPFTIEDIHFSGSSFDDRTSSTNWRYSQRQWDTSVAEKWISLAL